MRTVSETRQVGEVACGPMARNRTRLERSLVGPAGEHYVLYKLYLRGRSDAQHHV